VQKNDRRATNQTKLFTVYAGKHDRHRIDCGAETPSWKEAFTGAHVKNKIFKI